MDRELEEQIEDLIQKATKDLKTRIVRVVSRHQTKLLREQARELKTGGGSTTTRKSTSAAPPSTGGRGKTAPVASKSSKSKKETKYHSDSDSDGYYSD